MKPTRSIVLLLSLQILGCAPSDPAVPDEEGLIVDDSAEPALDAVAADLPDEVVDELVHGLGSRLLVRLSVDPVPEHPMSDPRRLQQFAERWPDVVADFESTLPLQAWVARSYRHVPVIAVDVEDLTAAYAVLDHPDVLSVEPDVIHEMVDTSALAHIGQADAEAQGYTGDGTTIVVVDTGLNYLHSDFGCTAPGVPAGCPVVAVGEFAPQDNQLDANGHGTNVAAISLSVAPGADLIGLDVFDGAGASTSDILDALDWSVANQATYNIASINMSLGLGGYTSECGNSAFEVGIAAAKAAGMSVVVASGNDSFTNAISSPACSPSAFSVGAVLDDYYAGNDCTGTPHQPDLVACFSNSASFLDLLAPGVMVTGGGYEMSGTSMAAPHVAGAMAVLRAADPNATVDELQQRLKDTGVSVTDLRNGLSFPRLDLAAAVDGAGCSMVVDPSTLSIDALGESGTISVTTQDGCDFSVTSSAAWLSVTPSSGSGSTTLSWTALPNTGFGRTATLQVGTASVAASQVAGDSPQGSVVIEGDAVYTNTGTVTLTLDAPGSEQMCISNNAEACITWEPYDTTKTWRLKGRGSGERTVYAWFAAGGVIGNPVSDTILYDRTAPRDGDLQIIGAIEAITLQWGEFTDDLSGVVSYKVVQEEGIRAPYARCIRGTVVYEGTGTTVALAGLDGSYGWRVCPVDAAGNVGAGVSELFTTRPEYDAPTGSIVLEGGRDYTNLTRLTATLSASDPSGVARMCLSTYADRCTRFVDFATEATVTVRGYGEHTVYAWFEDVHGNRTAALQDTITVERGLPIDGTVDVTSDDATITLTVAGFSDPESGIASYRVMGSTTSASPGRRCRGGQELYDGPGDTIVLSGLTNGQQYLLQLCAVDLAGNVSSGVSGSATPVPERIGPVGSIDLGGRYTPVTAIDATLTASDPSGVTEMCVTNRLPCRRFVPFSSTIRLSVPPGDTTFYAQFKDTWGNESELVSAVIGLDRRAPEDGTLTAARGDGQIGLSFAGFTDEQSGVAGYRVFQAEGTVPPRSCRGEPTWTGTDTSVTFTGLTNGQPYSFLVCATDGVGNVSRGVRGTWSPAPELDPPTGAMIINSGDEWTRNRRVELSITASDASGVARMCVDTRESDRCTRWTAYAETYRASLSGSTGPVAVRVWFEDVWGNQTETYIEDTIGLDEYRPEDGALNAHASGTDVTLSWSGFSEPPEASGIASYTVIAREGRAPSNCRVGIPVYEGTDTTATATGLLPGTVYGFRVCANDLAGNQSRGVGDTVTTGE